LVSVEQRNTRNGKDRWIGRTNDGREFGIWDRALADAAGAHLHESLDAEVSSRQDDNGNWWNNLISLPALGVSQPPRQNSQSTPSAPVASPGMQLDLADLRQAADRIALALENILQFQVERFLSQQGIDDVTDDDGPPEPEGM
jgi:hypothetical protein